MAEQTRTQRRRADREAKKEGRQKIRHKKQATSLAQKAAIFTVAALLAAGIGYWAYNRWSEGSPGQFFPSMGNRHITEGEVGLTKYNSDPPTSGPHVPQIATWGIHTDPVPKEFLVHNLEDGGVVINYNCTPAAEDCKELVDKLEEIVRKYDNVVLAPYPGMSGKIALTAWTRLDKLDQFNEKRILRFVEAYIHIDHHPVGGEG